MYLQAFILPGLMFFSTKQAHTVNSDGSKTGLTVGTYFQTRPSVLSFFNLNIRLINQKESTSHKETRS